MKFEDFINKQVVEDARNQQRDNLALFKKKQQELFNLQMDPATQIYEEQIKQKLSALNEWAKSQGILENTTPLSIGDPVIITGDVEFNGSTGEIESFGKDNNFVVVNLYNHGRHSFQSSDVEYNEYADSDDEEARAYDNDMDARNWNAESVAEASWDRKDAYERDYEHSIAGMGKRQSYAYSQDGGANDEGDDSIDAKIRADYEKKKQYEQTGKFWLKQKDTQQHINDTHYTGKSAANSAALELLKQRPELKGNLVITAYGPDEKNESVVNELTGWTQAPRPAQKRTTKPATEYKGNTDKRSELQRSKDAGNKNWFKMKETGNAPQQRVVEGSKPNKTHLAMAYLKAVVMAPTGTPDKRRILNWQQTLSNQFDIDLDTAALAQMLPQFDNMLQAGKLDKLQNRMASRGELYIESVEQGVAEGSSTTWEVSYDYGPHMTKSVTVKAGSESEARAKVEKAAEKKGLDIMINSVEQGVSEGSGFDKWADERAASQLHKLKKPHPETWHDVDKKLGQAVDKMSQAAKVAKGLAHPDTLKKKGVAEVSKATLDQYVPKAVDAHGHADFSARMSKDDPTLRSYHVDQKRTAEKRRQGIGRALDRMSKMEGVEKSTDELYGLRVGDTVKAVINGKRVQGDVIDIFPETMEVELLLRGANAGRTVTVDVRDTEALSEQGVAEDSDPNTQSHADAFKSETDTMKPGTSKYVGRKGGKEVTAKKDEQGNVKFYHRDGIKGPLKRVNEMDKSQTPPGRSGASPDSGKEYTAKPIKANDFAKDAGDQWIKNLSKDQLDAIAGPRYKKKGVAEGSEDLELYGLHLGDTVRAVLNGKRVQGDVIDIFPETMEVELLLRGANAGRTVTVDVRDTEFMNEQGVAENVTHKGGEVSHKGTVTRHKAGPGVYGGSEYDTDPDTEIDKNFINRSEKTMGIKWPREKKYQGSINVTEATDDSPVVNAITQRILLQRADLLSKYGLDAVVDAIDEVADFVGDVEEIGSSDVSGWVKHVEQMLGNMEEGVAEADNKIADRHDPEDFDAMVTRLRKLAGQGELKTVWDPVKRVYKNVPVSQEKK